jgi:hypothetical protein
MSLWLIDEDDEGGLSDCFAGVFRTSQFKKVTLPFILYADPTDANQVCFHSLVTRDSYVDHPAQETERDLVSSLMIEPWKTNCTNM